MTGILPVLIFWSCTGEPTVPTVPATPPLPFDQTGAAPVAQLDRLPATLVLPATNRAEAAVPTVFKLTDLSVERAWNDNGMHKVTAAMPFEMDTKQAKRFAPTAVTVTVNGEPIANQQRASPRRRLPHWATDGSQIELVVETLPEPGGAQIVFEGLRAHLDRLQLDSSGLSEADFVQYTHHIGDRSRSGLLLPAPATAEWTVTVPEGGRFDSFVAMVPSRLLSTASDGATVSLTVVDGGAEKRLAEQAVSYKPGLMDTYVGYDGGFAHWQVDMSAYAGKTVTLKLASEAGANNLWDFVFLGSPVISGAPKAPPRRVVVIGLDTTRPDHMSLYGYGRDTTPEIDAWAEGAAVFEQSWAPAPRTRPSFRTATTGRYPLDAVGATNIGEVFDANGFATAGIVANVHLNRRFDFDRGFDDWWLDPEAKADDQVDRALNWLERNRHRDTYLFLHIMDPHLFYFAPEPYNSRWVSDPDPTLVDPRFNRWQAARWPAQGKLTKRRQAHIEALYDGELAYTSSELDRFFKGLAELGGNDLVVMHSDHGEEFWEHGGFEHNHTLYDEVVRTVMAVQPPPGSPARGRIAEPVTLADIAPTLYDYTGFDNLPATDGRSLRGLVAGTDEGGWNRSIGVAHLMYDRERWGVVHNGHKYVLHTESGREELYNLAADPIEGSTLSMAQDTTQYWKALGKAHNMPIGPGWRIDATLRNEVVVIELPAEAVGAGVIDPEAAKAKRANLAWGEPADRLPEDVAVVTLDDTGKRLTITKGSVGRGTLWVMFDQQPPIVARITDENGSLLGRFKPKKPKWTGNGNNLFVRPGIVFDTPPGEAARMGTIGAAGSDQTCELCALGYLEGDSCEPCR